MNREHVELWLHDLETTIDPQIRSGHMTEPANGDCCLGRLCKVAIADGVELDIEVRGAASVPARRWLNYDGAAGTPPIKVRQWLGVSPRYDDVFIWRCVNWNDNAELTFKEIAAEIRKELG
jgi:hypothetical protein